MASSSVGLIAVFTAGVLSFISPCVFPLVPGYLSYLTGTTARDVQAEGIRRWPVTIHAVFFVLGFALIFALLGAVASALGSLLSTHKGLLERGAGLLIIVFGIALTGLVPLPFLGREKRMHVATGEPGLIQSALVGVAFGAGWSPCIGPILGSVLALAATGATLTQGVLYLIVYAIGLGIPFLLVGVLLDRVGPLVRYMNRYTGPTSIVGGVILVITGAFIFSGHLEQLATYAPIFGG